LVKERGMKAHEECKTEAAKSVRSRFGGGETSARKRKRMDETWDGDCGSEELMNDGGVKEHTDGLHWSHFVVGQGYSGENFGFRSV
jgi:hypothetical protein